MSPRLSSDKMKFSSLQTLFAVAIASNVAIAQAADSVESSGYLRLGTAQQRVVGKDACFQLPGASSKYRLGNECDLYAELLFAKEAVPAEQGKVLRGTVMVSVWRPDVGAGLFDDAIHGVKQAYLEIRDGGEPESARLWAGRRFYKRHAIHIVDYFYNDPSGTGIGVENIRGPGSATFSYAYMIDSGNGDRMGAHRHNIQLHGLAMYEGGTLDLAVSRTDDSNPGDGATAPGTGLMAEWHHRFKGGGNRLAYQVGFGSAAGANAGGVDYSVTDRHTKRWQLVDHVDFQATHNLGGQFLALYEMRSSPQSGIRQRWTSVGGRIAYAWNDHLKWLCEVGRDTVFPDDGPRRRLTKITMGPALALNRNFWSRPELRVYYTYARWNRAAQMAAAPGSALSVSGNYGSDRRGHIVGAQLEYWW